MDILVRIGLSNALLAAVLALGVAALGLLCRRPALMHGLWLLVLLKLVTPPLLPLPIPRLTPGVDETAARAPGIGKAPDLLRPAAPAARPLRIAAVETAAPAGKARRSPPGPRGDAGDRAAVVTPAAPPATVEATGIGWQGAVLALWLAGSCAWWTLAAWRIRCFHGLCRLAVPAPPALQDQGDALARRLGLARCPAIYLVPAPVSPLLWALGTAPRLLLPAALWERLTGEQRQTVLAHELAHLRRRDHWVRRLELLALGLYWWHPVAWWARRRLREAEEQCCDAWVVWALPAAAPAYAAALVETVAFLSRARPALPPAASGVGHFHTLKRRLTMILRGTPPRALSGAGWLAVLGLGALLLPLLPTWGEEPSQTEPRKRPAVSQAEDRQPRKSDTQTAPFKKQPTFTQDLQEPVTNTDTRRAAKAKPRHDARRTESGTDLSEQIELLRDEIEIQEVQLQVKRAQLQASQVTLEAAMVRLGRVQRLAANRTASAEDLEQVREKVDTLKAQLQIKQAELKEPEVRLRQAQRRLARLQKQRGDGQAGVVCEQPSRDFGVVKHGELLTHRFVLLNQTGQPAHAAAVRTTGSFVTALIRPTNLPAGGKAVVTVKMDTVRFTGPKTARVIVAFDRPEAHEVSLLVRADSQQGGKAKPSGKSDRLQELEKKLDTLLKEVDALRKELRPRKTGLRKGTRVPEQVVSSRRIDIPIQLDPNSRNRVRAIVLFSSTDGGHTWKQESLVKPTEKSVVFNAPSDGQYWFALLTVDDQHKYSRPVTGGLSPSLIVRVETQPEK
jgi:beta-lactamase regulating signal transducer with metallopeptidase domain